MVLYIILFTSFSLPFSELSLWDWPLTWLTNNCPSVLWHCWLDHLTHKVVPKMTHNMSSGRLNPTIAILYLYMLIEGGSRWWIRWHCGSDVADQLYWWLTAGCRSSWLCCRNWQHHVQWLTDICKPVSQHHRWHVTLVRYQLSSDAHQCLTGDSSAVYVIWSVCLLFILSVIL